MKTNAWLAVLHLGLLAAAASADDKVQRVAGLGQPSRLDVKGAETFAPEEIREVLFNDLEIASACDADAPLQALTDLLANKTATGYQAAGFPDVTVRVVPVGDRLVATIEEGERFTAGQVDWNGTRDFDAGRINDELTPPADAKGVKRQPLWRAGEPAPFHGERLPWLASKIQPLLGDQGFYRAAIYLKFVPDREAKRIDLRIDVVDQGPRTTVADLQFTGNEKSSSDTLKTYLALEPDALLTGEMRKQIERRLLRSGRFLSVRWELGEIGKRDDAWRPQLKLREYDLAPPIDEPISREEAALLKLAEWVEQLEQSDEQVLIRFREKDLSIVFAPRRGFIVSLAAPHKADASEAAPSFGSALVMAEDIVGLYSSGQRRKLVAAPPPSPLVGQAGLTLIAGAPAWDGRGRADLSVGLHSGAKRGYRRHIDMQLRLTAAAALSVVRKHEAAFRWDGDVLSVEWNDRMLRMNAATGQLIEQTVHFEAPSEAAEKERPWTAHVTIETDEFERRLAEIEKLSADWPNMADAERPLSCLGEFICDEAGRFDAASQCGCAALGKLVSLGALTPFDDLLLRACRSTGEGFSLPLAHWEAKPFHDLPAAARAVASAFGVRLADYLWPHEGWLNPLWRDGVFALAGKPVQLSGELSGQHARERGPLCGWLTAELLHAAKLDMLSTMRARQGLRQFSLEAFEKDCGDLVSGQGFVSQYLLRLTEALQKLDAEEVEALGELVARLDALGGPQGAALRQCLASLRSSPDDTPAQAAMAGLRSLWDAGLSDLVEWRLKALAPPPAFETPVLTLAPGREPRPAPGGAATDAAPIYPVTEPPEADAEPYGDVAPERGNSVRQEITELKWLARTIADRLQKLEERLPLESVEEINDSARGERNVEKGELVIAMDEPSRHQQCEVAIRGPNGLKFVPEFFDPGRFDQAMRLPMRLRVDASTLVYFKLADMPGHPTENLYLVLHIRPLLAGCGAPLWRFNVPITLTERDIQAAASGKAVTKVLYTRNEKRENAAAPVVEAMSGAEAGPGTDPVAEAGKRGTILAVARLQNSLSGFPGPPPSDYRHGGEEGDQSAPHTKKSLARE